MLLQDTAAIVTGGASGLGAATARELAAKGARVFALDLPDAVAKAPEVDGVTHTGADVTDAEQVSSAVELAAGSGLPLRTLVNCAGIGPSARVAGRKGPHDLDLFRKVVEVNLVGTFNTLRLAAAAIGETEPDGNGQRGVVVNTASIAAHDGQIGQAAYAASKGGVASLTLPAARDLASAGIRVMTIAPGIVDTPMLATVGEEIRETLAEGVPFPKRLGTPEDYAGLALDIIEHDYLNGEVIRMDGGLRMGPK
ncbi:3-hydroxyacyl-CoA dehydrogenase [Actinopolyspora erythraea]|uniref:3-hydroxy-2-methylbutyryl-CoA dehydrogenase n=1 Tax=Actinopolyspora erythraea TaxID=414996 RepID=A0A099DB18_9ACTN|nr:SDR family NAD(P)-dependent oxidoreductase [Actinopolyspora erythraea]ASU77042.1 3-hydroxyacyl-CoA dehydrogenase [Actinopolyspora erythraea]KGI83066.1 3-hydroxy-2-methylbutyryl-CoA dehydrogenase [Actinopolyspora erythraea]